MTPNRITQEHIDELLASLSYKTTRVPDTTTTLCTAAMPGGFVVAIGMSACVDPANFDAERGIKYAIEDAQRKATAELWKLEGYVLSRQLAGKLR